MQGKCSVHPLCLQPQGAENNTLRDFTRSVVKNAGVAASLSEMRNLSFYFNLYYLL